jgi:hypothetical protein
MVARDFPKSVELFSEHSPADADALAVLGQAEVLQTGQAAFHQDLSARPRAAVLLLTGLLKKLGARLCPTSDRSKPSGPGPLASHSPEYLSARFCYDLRKWNLRRSSRSG